MNLSIPPFTRLAIVASLAAGAAYWLGTAIPDNYVAPVPAAVTAVAVTSTTAVRAWKMSVLQVVGIGFGAALALLAVKYLGYTPLTIIVLVAASFGIVSVLRLARGFSAPKAAASIAVSVIIVLGSHLSTNDAFNRFFGVLVGAIIGFAFSFLVATNSSLEEVSEAIDGLYEEVGDLSADISSGLAVSDTSQSREWAQRAMAIRDQYRDMRDNLRELEQSSKWSPLISQTSAAGLLKRYEALGMTITRLVAVTSDLKFASKRNLLDDAPTSVMKPLARLFEDVSQTLDPDEPNPSRSHLSKQTRKAIQAASGAHLETKELVAISGIAQNARRLVSLEDTQPMPVIEDGTDESQS